MSLQLLYTQQCQCEDGRLVRFSLFSDKLTCSSVSAEGRLRVLLMRDIFTKLWKPADLQTEEDKDTCISSEEDTDQITGAYAHLPLGFILKFWRLEAALGHQHQRSEKQCERRHWTGKCPSSNHPESAKSVCLQLFVQSPLFVLTHLIGCRSNMGGCSSASSMAVMPTAQISHRWL